MNTLHNIKSLFEQLNNEFASILPEPEPDRNHIGQVPAVDWYPRSSMEETPELDTNLYDIQIGKRTCVVLPTGFFAYKEILKSGYSVQIRKTGNRDDGKPLYWLKLIDPHGSNPFRLILDDPTDNPLLLSQQLVEFALDLEVEIYLAERKEYLFNNLYEEYNYGGYTSYLTSVDAEGE